MRTLDLTETRTFTLTNPKNKEMVTFLGSEKEAKEDYLSSINSGLTLRENGHDFFWWCNTTLVTIDK